MKSSQASLHGHPHITPVCVFSKWRIFFGAAVAICALAVQAQTNTTSYQELSKAVIAPDAIASVGADLFGDQINLYTGAVEFVQTDVSLRGNNALPVMVGRRLVAGVSNGGGRPFGLWDLEIPHLHGMFSKKDGWKSQAGTSGSRCTNFGPPPSTTGTNNVGNWDANEFWGGDFLYVPGVGDQQMLSRDPENTVAPGPVANYRIVTAKLWSISCLPTLANSSILGEGFLATAPDGTQYQFDQLVTYAARGLSKSYSAAGALTASTVVADANSEIRWSQKTLPIPNAPTSYLLQRNEVWILPTKVTDRYGNFVTYTYDTVNPANVKTISSSDGRTLTFSYNSTVAGNATGISSVTDGTRTWNYAYHGAYATASLDSVVLPDASTWQLSNTDVMVADVSPSGGPSCEGLGFITSRRTGTMTHPSGATGSFTLTPTLHGRSGVFKGCSTDGLYSYPAIPKYFYAHSLTNKTIAGPGLQTMAWNYTYSNAAADASWAPCNGCKTNKTVNMTDPNGNVTVYTFGNQYNISEGKLQQVDIGWNGSTALRTTTTSYNTPGAGPYPTYAGFANTASTGDSDFLARLMPVRQIVTTQQGVTFTWTANAFDTLARPIGITRSNSLGNARTENTVYSDNFPKYVLGQIGSVTETSTAQVMISNSYDSVTADLLTNTTFGHLNQTFAYYSDGTLRTSKDGNGNITSYSNYRAGIPQNTAYADGSYESVAVNSIGKVTSKTDAAGFLTAFGYDGMGRINLVTYPAGDSVAWNNTSILVEEVAITELGIAAGHWRQTVATGNARSISYFDGLLRPVLTRAFDANAPGTTGRAMLRQYDLNGNIAFQSYPQRDISDVANPVSGVATQFDALARATTVTAASDLGNLVTQYQFSSPFQRTVIDPRGNATTSSFFAFDTPSEADPSTIYLPQDISVTIARDIFGKPVSITRGDGTKSATRNYVYDVYQRLCKTIEPETGATVQSYDGGNNTIWRATGLNLPSASTCDTASVPANVKVSFNFDARNRLTSTGYSDGSPSIVRTYTPDSLPNTINSNGSVWTNTYNKRRLNERESLVYGGVAYNIDRRYDPNASLSSLTYPIDNLTLNYTPNALGEPTQVGGYASAISYFPNGAVAGFAYGNGIAHSMTQNIRGLPSQSTDAGVLNDSYTYDANGNVAGITDLQTGTNTRTMSYDNLDRLTSVSAPNLWGTATYGYDGLDNLTSSTITAGATARSIAFNYPDPATNRLMSASGTSGYNFTYAYDSQGNIVQRGAQQYTFDQGNRLSGAVGLATYGYDGLGHRFTVVGADGVNRVQIYSQEGQLLYVAPTNGAGTKYVHLHNHVVAEVTNGVVTYDHTDGLGSPVAQSDASRSVGPPIRYEPYGYIAAGAPLKIGFTGHVNDNETSLIYMQQRYYDPVAGRFLSIDPVTTDAGTGSSFNRYDYANNNPYGNVDPDGRQAQAVIPVVGGILLIGGYKYATDPKARAVVNRMVAAAISSQSGPKKNDSADTPKSDGKKDTLQPGPHAGDSVPARGPDRDFNNGERGQINEIGVCHTCGSTDPGTSSGNFIPDHQPPNALNPSGGAQQLYPHCLTCSRVQGGQVRGQQIRQPKAPEPKKEPSN